MGMIDQVKGLFRRKSRLEAVFIDETKGVEMRNVKYDANTFEVKELGKPTKSYLVDPTAVYTREKTKMPIAFYYKNNPEPIKLSHKRNGEIDGIGLTKLLDDKTIQELFSDDSKNILFWLMIMVGVSLLMSFVILGIEMGWIKIASKATGAA